MNEDFDIPKYSYWPMFLAVGIGLIAIGLVSTVVISVFGLLLLFVSLIGWTWENRSEPQEGENEQS